MNTETMVLAAAGAERSRHIDVRDVADVARWSREFGLTRLQLLGIVDRLGTDARVVREAVRQLRSMRH